MVRLKIKNNETEMKKTKKTYVYLKKAKSSKPRNRMCQRLPGKHQIIFIGEKMAKNTEDKILAETLKSGVGPTYIKIEPIKKMKKGNGLMGEQNQPYARSGG